METIANEWMRGGRKMQAGWMNLAVVTSEVCIKVTFEVWAVTNVSSTNVLTVMVRLTRPKSTEMNVQSGKRWDLEKEGKGVRAGRYERRAQYLRDRRSRCSLQNLHADTTHRTNEAQQPEARTKIAPKVVIQLIPHFEDSDDRSNVS